MIGVHSVATCEAVFEATRDWVWDLDLFLQVKNIGTIFRWGRGKHLVEEWRTFKLCRCTSMDSSIDSNLGGSGRVKHSHMLPRGQAYTPPEVIKLCGHYALWIIQYALHGEVGWGMRVGAGVVHRVTIWPGDELSACHRSVKWLE